MRSILIVLVILLLPINFILGLPRVVDLIQTQVLASNIPVSQTENGSAAVRVQNQPLVPQDHGLLPPEFSATAILVSDLDSGNILWSHNPDKKVPIASTTKIMTAITALSYFKLNDILEVPDLSVSGSTMGLLTGEKLTFRSLLYGLLLNSGNDAAYTIAAGFPGGVPAFVESMNQKTKDLKLFNTHFDNPAGFDSPNHFSSASDLAKIASAAVSDSQLARVVGTKETSVASTDKSIIHDLKNLNKLLDTPGVKGIKTGTTPEAKENLVGLVERGSHRILTIVLGSDDRFGETQKLIEWTYTNFTW